MSCRSIGIPIALSILAIAIVILIPIALKFWVPPKHAVPVPIPDKTQLGHNMTSTEFNKNLDSFGSKLFSELSQVTDNKSIFISPLSIQSCIAMVRMGADGQTALDIDSALNFTGNSLKSIANNYQSLLTKYENSSLLTIANKIYIKQSYAIQANFNEMLSKKFFSSAETIDFSQTEQAANAMNNWVQNKTENAIANIVSPAALNGDSRIFLLSAIHFKGEWATTFTPNATMEQNFYTNENSSIKVQMMSKNGLYHYNTFADLDAAAVRLLYKDSDLSMLVFLPNTRTGLAGMLKKLKHMPLENITQEMRARTYVQVYLPKFKVEFETELKDVLTKMGLSRMFSFAEFGRMLNTTEPLQVSSVIHKTFIEVDEKGTEAAAATGVAVTTRDGSGLQSLLFRAEHPFYYVITNADNVKLFEGTFRGV